MWCVMFKKTFIASVLLMLIAGGCASVPSKNPEEQVAERAQARIDALMAGDYKKAYSFTSPGYRSAYPLVRYKARYLGAGNWTYAKAGKASCEDALCKVAIDIKYKSIHAKHELPSLLNEKWILVDGVWYLYLK